MSINSREGSDGQSTDFGEELAASRSGGLAQRALETLLSSGRSPQGDRLGEAGNPPRQGETLRSHDRAPMAPRCPVLGGVP